MEAHKDASINPASSASYSPRPLLVIYLGTHKDAARVPGYAAYTPDPLAKRVMANSEWRAAHTCPLPTLDLPSFS
ncbi:hypothetical protein C8R48DRAFT_718340 [Suillus tomentosus]|nr:hypothetical protein C8R48DRAFT_718340 [Suillus tomentosus]